MPASLIDGKAIAEQRQEDLRGRIAELLKRGIRPRLVALSVGADPGWTVYADRQAKTCATVGIDYRCDDLPPSTSQEQLAAHIEQLNADPAVHGIIIQSPLPAHLQQEALQALLSPAKDVEGVHPANLGMVLAGRPGTAPCTAVSAVTLAEAAVGDLRGKEIVVVGASVIVGRPVAELVLARGATPTVTHIDTQDVASHCRRADVLFVAVGRAGLITADMVKPGACVIDVGINRVPGPDGKSRIVGDVDPGVADVAAYLTPVPGGVGALTTTVLMEATVSAAEGLAESRPVLTGYALVQALGDSGLQLAPDLADRLASLLSRHMVQVGEGAVIKSPLQRRLDQGLVVLDGAMGTELMAHGVSSDALEQANLDQPDVVAAVHRAYLEAGAHVLTTNTFRANRFHCGGSEPAVRLAQAGVRLARQVAYGRALVLGSIGPLGPVLGAEIDETTAHEAFAEIALAMADAGADGFLVETMTCTAEARCAVAAIKSVSSLPVLASRPFAGDDADDIAEFVDAMVEAGVAALGANCVSGLRSLLPAVRRLTARSSVPVLVNPNAGFPRRRGSACTYDLDPSYFVHMATAYAEAGARMIGGCCGVGPSHIRALAQAAPGITCAVPASVEPAVALAAAPIAHEEHPFLAAMRSGAFPAMTLVAGRFSAAAERRVLCDLGRSGAAAIGFLGAQAAGMPTSTVIARLRNLQDSCDSTAVLSLSAGEIDLARAQELLLGAHLLGMRLVLIDTGVFAQGGRVTGPGASTEQLLDLIARLNGGRDLSGNRLQETPGFTVGVRLSADSAGELPRYVAAGASFGSIQPIYDAAGFRQAMARAGDAVPLLAEILILPDAETAVAVDNELPALTVPERLIRQLEVDPQEDLRGVLRFLAHWRSRLGGVCLLLPDERCEPARAVLEALRE